MKKIVLYFILLIIFSLCLSGCDQDAGKPTPTVEIYQPTRSVATVVVATAAPSCTNVLSYSQYSDLSQVVYAAPGEKFTVEWEVINYSSCIWDERYHLFFISGVQMGAPDFVEIPRVPIGSKAKIAVTMTAPEEPGEYHSEWKMFGNDNRFFGESLVLDVTVENKEENLQ